MNSAASKPVMMPLHLLNICICLYASKHAATLSNNACHALHGKLSECILSLALQGKLPKCLLLLALQQNLSEGVLLLAHQEKLPEGVLLLARARALAEQVTAPQRPV